ncbi:MAG: GNAT family N-acetyltransferase [Chitinophagales bacterium]
MEIFIRQISREDAPTVTALCHQLGYNPSIEQTLESIEAILNNKDHDGFVAIHENKVIGWIGVCQAIQIESPRCCEIRGLVVDNLYRNRGVGKMLIEKAKSWSRETGNKKLRLRCNMKRTETHLFYQHLNFKEVKEQKVFEIDTW